MASAEVLSKPAVSSKNKKNLEAGRRKLEEFRKKKAQSKNGKLKNQPSTDDATTYDKQSAENGQTSTVDSASTQNDGGYNTVAGTSGLSDNSSKLNVTSHHYGPESIPLAHVDALRDKFREPDLLQKLPRHGENNHEAPGLNYQTGPNFTSRTYYSDGNTNSSTEIGEGIYSDLISSSRPIALQDSSSNDSHKISYDVSSSVSFPYANVGSYDVGTKGYSEGLVTTISHQEPDSVYSTKSFPASAPDPGHSHQEFKNHLSVALEERNSSNSLYNFASLGSQRTSESYSTGFKSTVGGLYNGPTYSPENESYVRRSRPSFLDSLNIKNSSVSGRSFVDTDKTMNNEISSSNVAVSSAFHSSFSGSPPTLPLHIPASSNPSDNIFGNASKGHNLFEQSLESKLDHASQKQNEDFAALEQHIEDLTQEKFSLQRALEASKSLAESLAAENSSLTESYNQQASTVSQLKADMEGLQEEIKARLVELEAVKAEYMNAQLECNAADERAKLLASEVISLEEKALRLRSSELKLERELENSSAEIASYKKKISTLDKERRDLLETINALQEEKKLLQSKLRRASASGISIDFSKGHTKKDASTSTNDIGPDAAGDSSEHASTSMQTHDSVDNNMLLLQDILADQENIGLNIPPDQVQMIQNIDSLIAEINSEKKELMQALIAEVSTSTKLKELNKELSQKLEVQTQRLELLTAQSMASEFAATKQAPIAEIVRESVAYADEGDEVVERVLGWIMKLFPGGPSKRRTSRL